MVQTSNAESLAAELRAKRNSGERVKTKLQTDQRVLARVTDGIYRQPASALRELISNAYDADAENLWIQTDAPRFNEIIVEDDGNGLTLEALANLVHHIGGSPKRTPSGIALGVTSDNDVRLSPGGRRLIGKIGIGLFSVAQLTRHFQIITKRKGEKYRLIADVQLRTYSEDLVAGDIESFDSGDVEIWSEKATDTTAHGTTIVLMSIRDYTKSLLQTRDRWERVQSDETTDQTDLVRTPPRFHIGSLDPQTGDTRRDDAHLPWKPSDNPDVRFRNLYQAVLDEVGTSTSNPSIEDVFDNYLGMIWHLALSVPVEYIAGHPFELSEENNICFFKLSNESQKQATKVSFAGNTKKVGIAAGLTLPAQTAVPFHVFIDDIELFRPIRFTDLPSQTSAALKTPMLFIGRCQPDLSARPTDVTGGSQLSFEAYFFWSPKVVPKENNGIIIRIANASGSLFDDTFMHYEVSEQTRLRQITAEIFVIDGLDAALNIDRESFNYAHPHYQFLTRWVHRALRQVTNKHKELGRAAREQRLLAEATTQVEVISTIVQDALHQLGERAPDNLSEVEFVEETSATEDIAKKRKEGALVFHRDIALGQNIRRTTNKSQQEQNLLEQKMIAVAQLLNAYGLLAELEYKDQEELLRAICRLFQVGDS